MEHMVGPNLPRVEYGGTDHIADHPMARGYGGNDVTSFLAAHKHWKFDLDSLNHIEDFRVLKLLKAAYGDPPKAGIWKHGDTHVVLDMDNHPLLDWPDVPKVVSSQIDPAHMEILCRRNRHLKMRDFRGRMPPTVVTESGKEKALFGETALGNKMDRFRVEHCIPAWRVRAGSQNITSSLLGYLSQAEIDAGEIRTLRFLSKEDQYEARKANEGKHLYRAGTQRLDEKTRAERAAKLTKSRAKGHSRHNSVSGNSTAANTPPIAIGNALDFNSSFTVPPPTSPYDRYDTNSYVDHRILPNAAKVYGQPTLSFNEEWTNDFGADPAPDLPSPVVEQNAPDPCIDPQLLESPARSIVEPVRASRHAAVQPSVAGTDLQGWENWIQRLQSEVHDAFSPANAQSILAKKRRRRDDDDSHLVLNVAEPSPKRVKIQRHAPRAPMRTQAPHQAPVAPNDWSRDANSIETSVFNSASATPSAPRNGPAVRSTHETPPRYQVQLAEDHRNLIDFRYVYPQTANEAAIVERALRYTRAHMHYWGFSQVLPITPYECYMDMVNEMQTVLDVNWLLTTEPPKLVFSERPWHGGFRSWTKPTSMPEHELKEMLEVFTTAMYSPEEVRWYG